MNVNMLARRPYRMTARAAAVAATRDRILDAARELLLAGDLSDVPLSAVAARAETTVQTVLRHVGSKAGLLDALIAREAGAVAAERERVPVGDADAAAAYLARHYAQDGDMVLRLLAAEERSEPAARVVAGGRALHRAWVARTFAPWLRGLGAAARRRRLEQLVAVTDVYAWKLMRRDGGLDDAGYRRAVAELLHALAGGPR